MKRSKFSDEQILKIVREGEAGRKVAACAARTGSLNRRTTAGNPNMAASSSARCSG